MKLFKKIAILATTMLAGLALSTGFAITPVVADSNQAQQPAQGETQTAPSKNGNQSENTNEENDSGDPNSQPDSSSTNSGTQNNKQPLVKRKHLNK